MRFEETAAILHGLVIYGTRLPVSREYFRFSVTIIIHSCTLRSLVNLSPPTDVDFRWKVFMISSSFLMLNYIVNPRSTELYIFSQTVRKLYLGKENPFILFIRRNINVWEAFPLRRFSHLPTNENHISEFKSSAMFFLFDYKISNYKNQ